MRLVLASKSPRRKEILEKMGLSFDIITAPTDETLPDGIGPEEGVRILAVRKGEAVAKNLPDDVAVISSDTLVELFGVPLGKPKDTAEACRMLRSLSGQTHYVRTGVAVHLGTRVVSATASSAVRFRDLTDAEIEEYVATGEPMDKAGAYGIQGLGGALVAQYDGDFDTIMGLSSRLSQELLLKVGYLSEGEAKLYDKT